MSADLKILSREALEAENARLRRLLKDVGIEADRLAAASAGRDAAHRAQLASSRSQAASYLRHLRVAQRDAAAAERMREEELQGLRSTNADSAGLLAELRLAEAVAAASEERLALAFEASGAIGWWDWDVRADKVHAGAGFAQAFGIDPQAAADGLPVGDFVAGIHPDDRDRIGERIAAVLKTGGEFAEEYRLIRPDGAAIWIFARGRCYLDEGGEPIRFPGVAIDITERRNSEARKSALVELGDRLREAPSLETIAATAAEILARALRATRAGIGTVDSVRETVVMQPDWRAPGVASIAGLHHFRDYGSFVDDLKRGQLVVIGDVAADPRTAGNADALADIGVRVLVNLPIMEHGRLVSVVFVHHDRAHRWTEAELNFLRTVGDRTQAAIGRLHAEEQQRILNRELSHRLKNNLAMVQAIAAQTLRNASDLESARASLSNRLMTLGRAHELLLSGSVDATDMRAVTEATLLPHDDGGGRFRVEGAPVEIGSAAALSLALMLHELATNATKYGALSVPHGEVSVSWRIEETDDGPLLRFEWKEENGPPVLPPPRRGFGSRLIERGLAGSVGGAVELIHPPAGVLCRFTAPLAGLRPDHSE